MEKVEINVMWNNVVYFVKPLLTGPGVLDYTLHTEEHKCKKDALLGRIKHSPNKSWKLIRPRPTKTQYVGPYYICKGKKFYLRSVYIWGLNIMLGSY